MIFNLLMQTFKGIVFHNSIIQADVKKNHIFIYSDILQIILMIHILMLKYLKE